MVGKPQITKWANPLRSNLRFQDLDLPRRNPPSTTRLRSSFICLLWTLSLFLLPALVFAGTGALPLLRHGKNARALGMGGAYVAVASDATGVYWNPSGLAYVRQPGITFTNRLQNLGTRLIDMAFAVSASSRLGLGGAMLYYTVDDVPVIDTQAQNIGGLTEKQIALFAGGGYRIDKTSLGVALRYASHQLKMPEMQTEGTGLGGSLGILYTPTKALRVGVVLDSKLVLQWDDQHTDASPFGLRIGVAYHAVLDLNTSLNLLCDIEQNHQLPLKMHLGTEFVIQDGPHAFALRAGLRDILLETRGADIASGILVSTTIKPTFGLGFRWHPPESGSLRVDYALNLEAVGIRSIISLAYDF